MEEEAYHLSNLAPFQENFTAEYHDQKEITQTTVADTPFAANSVTEQPMIASFLENLALSTTNDWTNDRTMA